MRKTPVRRSPGRAADRPLGRPFGWLWGAYAVSAFGTWLAFDAIPLIAILVLHSGTAEVSVLAAAGTAVGAVVAVPLGPWVEFRRKRPVMIAMDLLRFAAMASIPVAFALGWLGFTQLLVVAVTVAASGITFNAAAGACLKALVQPRDLIVANSRFEATTWTAAVLGPPLGMAAIGVFGPVLTVTADAVSYLLSAVGIRAIGGAEPRPVRTEERQGRGPGSVLDGWRYILTNPALRPLLINNALVNSLIMASTPLLAVLMLGRLGFAPWQYGLAFAVPCLGGLLGSRLAQPLVTRFGQHKVLRTAGALRACWPLGLAFIGPGVAGLVLVMVVEFGLIVFASLYNTLLSAYRLHHTPNDRIARTLSAWSVTTKATTAVMTGLWGLLAGFTGPRTAIALAGVLLLTTPLLLRGRADDENTTGTGPGADDAAPGPAPQAEQAAPASAPPTEQAAPASVGPTEQEESHA
ncbi:MFS transporter [Streptomyces sp. NPDC050617]|uniref:MFS transporter n=1 Tax=Streptomyces sp. NPDC050617 TaxID=3154628 RepID=UPI00341E96C3